jgi:hypothetical protein
MTTPQWPAITEHVRTETRAGRTTLRDALGHLDPQEHSTPESFAQAVLQHLAPPAQSSATERDGAAVGLQRAALQRPDPGQPVPGQPVRRREDERQRRQDPPAAMVLPSRECASCREVG